jgi:uncharacterized membrane protein YeiH
MNFFDNFTVTTDQSLPVWIEVSAMMVSSLYGASVARSREAPIYGTLLAGVLYGLGGGMIRDTLLGLKPAAIYDWYYIPAILCAAVVGGLFFSSLINQRIPNLLFNGIAVGVLISIGAQKALVSHAPVFAALVCGIATASLGGMAVDALTQKRATVMQEGAWFGPALALGTIGYICFSVFVNFYAGIFAAIAIYTSLRVLSVTRNWNCPNWINKNTGN